jgi:Ca2+/H+ antiporter
MFTNLRESVFASVVVVSLLGLLGLSVIDENTRPVFQKVAEMSIAAYLGYLIPNK